MSKKEKMSLKHSFVLKTDKQMRYDKAEARVYGRVGLLALLAGGFLFIYVVFDVDDPIEIFDHFVNIILFYSKSVVWVKEFWTAVTIQDFGVIGWLIEKLFKVEVEFTWKDIFSLFGRGGFGWS